MDGKLTPAACAVSYLRSRGITRADAEFWQLGYDARSGRVSIPVLDHWGQPVFTTLRAINPQDQPKYLHVALQRGGDLGCVSQWLYGCHQEPNGKPPIIVEGHIDAIALHRIGYVGLAVMSSHLPTAKAAHAARFAGDDVVVLWPDSDNPDCVHTWSESLASVGLKAIWPVWPYPPIDDTEGAKLDPDWLVKTNRQDWIIQWMEGHCDGTD